MRPTLVTLSKASRFPLTSKHGNKDYYKGTGQAQPPGVGFRTGAPGKFVTKGTGSYRIVDEMVRIFIGPGFQEEGKSTFLRSEVSSCLLSFVYFSVGYGEEDKEDESWACWWSQSHSWSRAFGRRRRGRRRKGGKGSSSSTNSTMSSLPSRFPPSYQALSTSLLG
ncbi:hypothetical protein BDY24DRAFT_336927 [Mrakia frigida]|uniref:uncharacterized protein n=1 Tax=Mrakia frigida TaxID=29902 RepID=UPI003FCC0CE9